MCKYRKNILLTSVSFVLLHVSCFTGNLEAGSGEPNEAEALFDMSITQLMEVEIESTATLTKSKPRMVPAAVTTITAEQIQASGARSLNELLDIYVPNLQWIRHHWEADHLGLRGIINDRDDKYLLLVNGRVMNERTHYGVISERDLVMLQDIHHIDVIRGPGSALYGPGAVSMVISITTYNADTFQGTEITGRAGAIEEFYSGEYKHGSRFKDDDGGVFYYFGVGKYPGADQDDAPQVFGFDFPQDSFYSWNPADPGPTLPADGYQAGDPLRSPSINRDGETHRNQPPIKMHAQVTRGNWDMWARYTRGGKQFTWPQGVLTHHPWGWGDWVLPIQQHSSGYQQATGYVGYSDELSEKTDMELAFSYDMMDFERVLTGGLNEAYREDEYYFKAMFKHDLCERHKLAGGLEYSHEEFGFPSPGWPHLDNTVNGRFSGAGLQMPRWSTDMVSFLGEHQWTISDTLSSFIGARVDDHTYTEKMFSPRAALVWAPNTQDTFKFIWARSVRANFAEEMRVQVDSGNSSNSRPEKLDSLEIRYERTHSKNLDLAASFFLHYNLELISHSSGQNVPIGTQKEYGFEMEATYHTDRTRVMVSHGFTQLYDFHLEPGMSTVISARPYGYGKDLANWSNHVTKLVATHELDDKWTLDGSLRIYWGFPGLEDYVDYTLNPAGNKTYPAINPGWEQGYRGNYYLNLGLQYEHCENLTVRVDGYNLLGIFDRDLNKRNYFASMGDFRSHAPAVAVSLIYKFK